ncbi:ribosome-releasing factor 2, mitochondrial [Sinocyclocheilus rhinocerous]|uniref:ribosome-releasing factor 2, mitochondrial n=1 Tax=Sinocyclocheilus rhinocerous TaxID=307959 RepID=UPI0007B7C664|nr:PREDICTED: ribosome-releasing factor 2, mitochondrial [Sinocyclocheilus rhinocerous]
MHLNVPFPILRGSIRHLMTRSSQTCRGRVTWRRNYSFYRDEVKSLRAVVNPDISKIRNIGIMAHIDAGKTTTTERMLYFSGYTRALGDVDDGDTVTDYMAQERERGITIQSAAVTFDWKDHRINLIDTPEIKIPCVCFLNKMDKPAASLSYSIDSIKTKLKANPILLQIPIGSGKSFTGLVDLITRQKITWQGSSLAYDGRAFETSALQPSDDPDVLQAVSEARATLIEQVADLDDDFAELLLGQYSENFDAVPAGKLQEALRKVTLARKGVPVLCGTSLKNKGVQPLMDAITAYLPAPNERNHDLVRWYKDDLCALAFKVVHDKQRGPLVFVRIYSGSMKAQSAVYNINRNGTERMSRLLLPFADQHIEIPSLSAGNIALTVGLKQTVTGDTIVSSKASAAAAVRRAQKEAETKSSSQRESSSLALAGVEVPEPVFFCSIEPPTLAKQADLEHALNCLQREDPSLKVRTDLDSGQTILCGMGELHIEVIHDRIKREFNIETHLGPLQVAYRETILQSATATDTLDRTLGDKRHVVTVELAVHALMESSTSCDVTFEEEVKTQLSAGVREAVENGVQSAYLQGPVLGFPVEGVKTVIQHVSLESGTSAAMVSACVSRCMLKALKLAGGQVLEPVMALEVTVGEEYLSPVLAPVLGFPVEGVKTVIQHVSLESGTSAAMVSACVSRCMLKALKLAGGQVLEPVMALEVTVGEEYLSPVLADLAQRRGTVCDIQSRQENKVLLATVPLAEMMGYSTVLRTLTSGNATFSLELSSYEPMNTQDQNILLNKMAGLA